MKPTIVAYDGIGVIVNAGNPIKGLTKKQVEQIFTGDVTDWSAVGGPSGKISIYTRNTSSGTYSDCKELAMKKRDYASGSQKMAGNEQIAAEVGKNPKRHRLRRPCLHESRRHQGRADRRGDAVSASSRSHKSCPTRARPSTTRMASQPGWPNNSSISLPALRVRKLSTGLDSVPIRAMKE